MSSRKVAPGIYEIIKNKKYREMGWPTRPGDGQAVPAIGNVLGNPKAVRKA